MNMSCGKAMQRCRHPRCHDMVSRDSRRQAVCADAPETRPAASAVRQILNIPDLPFEPGPRPQTCQWVTNDGAPWTFCDSPVAHAGRSFCAHHHARAWYVPPPKTPEGRAPA
jgi:hypothetical protein